MIRWIEDQILSFLQRRCQHPGEMVTVDILEGCGNYEITYCQRCGAVRPTLVSTSCTPMVKQYGAWRRPMPNLWRG